MKCWFTLLVLVLAPLASAAPAPAPTEVPVPKGPPPTLSTAKMNADGNLVLTELVPVATTKVVPVEILIGGKKVTQMVRRTELRYSQVERIVKGDGLVGYDVKGKKLDARALANALRKRTVVALAADGKLVDPVYLGALKAGTVVLVIRPSIPPAPAPGADLREER